MDPKVTQYIEKQQSPFKEICQKLRKFILDELPDIKEEMKWGVPTYAGGKFYLVALKDHVNMGFESKNLTPAQQKLFDGVAKTMAHIEIKMPAEIDEKRIRKLIKLIQ
jgi:hypothetical protein